MAKNLRENGESADNEQTASGTGACEGPESAEGTSGASSRPRPPRRRPPGDPEEVVLAAAAIALTVSKGRTIGELQTLINLFTTTNQLLDTILKQRLINKAFELPSLDVEL